MVKKIVFNIRITEQQNLRLGELSRTLRRPKSAIARQSIEIILCKLFNSDGYLDENAKEQIARLVMADS